MRLYRLVCFVMFSVVSATDGWFETRCTDRHFWLFVKSRSNAFRIEVHGDTGVLQVHGQWMAECGYTLKLDSRGDLTLRVSYLACAVDNQGDSEFRLTLRFVNEGAAGEDISHHPLLLTCRLEEPWRPREVVCEQNYMEVSVEKPLPAGNHKGTEWVTPAPADDGLREWRVVFRLPDIRQHPDSGWEGLKEEIIPVNLIHLLGCSIITSATRIVLRCPHGSRLAYTLQGNSGSFSITNGSITGAQSYSWTLPDSSYPAEFSFTPNLTHLNQDAEGSVEVVSAAVLFRHQWTLLRVDTSMACSMTHATVDGTDIVWTFPWLMQPLVLPPVVQKSLKLAVGGHHITQCVAHHRGYRMRDDHGTIELRVPFGAEGGHLKSGVSEGVYSWLYEVDVELLRQWEDSAWKHTQQRTFRTLRAQQKHAAIITNYLEPSGGEFGFSVGAFLSDVVLKSVTLAERILSLEEAERNAVRISQIPLPNGTHSYLLQVPLIHPLVTYRHMREGYRNHSVSVLLSFCLSPGEVFQIPVSIHTVLQDLAVPFLEGVCTERGVRILVHYGSLQGEGTVYVGGLRLDQQLLRDGRYTVDINKEVMTIEIPLYAPGMDYRDLDLRGLSVSVRVSLVHLETMGEFTHLQECVLPVDDMLMCQPDGHMVALLNTSGVFPRVVPEQTVLLDPSCGPLDISHSRVLFSFPAGSCGSIVTHLYGHVIYTNEVRHLYPDPAHTGAHPHVFYRVPLMCMYPANGPRTVSIYIPRSTARPPAPLDTPPQIHSPNKQGQEVKLHPLPVGG